MNEGVPFLDLQAQYRSIKSDAMEAIQRVVDSQRFVLGPEVEALEVELAEYCGSPHAVGVSSGTDALIIALMACGIQPGDEVITTPYTFFATVGSIHRLGAKPVLVDIDPRSFNIDPAAVEAAITSRTRAIIPVHLFGRCVEMSPILDIAREREIVVVEDAAQSIGAEHDGLRAGSLGAVGCFSFYPAKNLGAFGDGGLVTCQDAVIDERLRMLRDHGAKPKYYHALVGGNFRLDALQAAVLRVKLRHLDHWSEARRANAEDYTRRFEASGLVGERLVLPEISSDRHVWNQYVLRAQNRDALLEHLRMRQVGCEVYYPVPLHLQECFRHLGYREGEYPNAEAAAQETLAIPVYPELTESQRAKVVEVIRAFYEQ